MLALAFFISVFSTLTWLIFSAAYINDHLGGVAFGSLGIMDISVYLGLILLPILVLWMVFGFINQYLGSRILSGNMFSLFKQMKKNQDYTDLIARIMLEAEQEIKDGFILGKFDLFIADMNELIADLLLRCNIASTEQIERLWTKVQNGGRWAFGKVLIEVNQNQPNFQMRIFDKSQHDSVIAGTVLEWCARYQSLTALLEKHDKERVFITIIETGVFGKVFSILAPVSDEIRRSREFAPAGPAAPAFAPQPAAPSSFEPEVPPAPKPKPGFAKQEDEGETGFFERIDTKSFAARLNPFRKKEREEVFRREEPTMPVEERDPLSIALERSFGNDEEPAAPSVSAPVFDENPMPAPIPAKHEDNAEPDREEDTVSAPKIEHEEIVIAREDDRFANTHKTLNDLKKEWAEMRSAAEPVKETEKKAADKTEEENYAYPFGGWTDEANYNK